MKRPVLGPLIAAFMVGAGLILGGLMGYLPNQLPDLATDYPIPFWSSVIGLIALLVGYSFAQAQQLTSTTKAEPTSSDQRQAEKNRKVMLEKVWSTWVEGVLNDSLYHETLIALHKQSRPDAVRPPRNAVIKQPEHTDRTLLPDTSILQVFDDSSGALLILGAPGSGKTTLLLDLTRDLIERAGREPNYPIPVVFPLSTWAVSRRPLDAWLVDELVDRYAVPRKLAHTWITSDSVLPLLDGLDEVVLSARDACVDAINAFRATRGTLPIAVCSRIADYDDLTVKLRLHSAIVVQPLSREQVRQYVRDIGFPFTPSSTSPLWGLLDTPLMLNIATLAYVDRPAAALRTTGDLAAMQEQLIAAYIERRLSQVPDAPYPAAQTKHYLAWLAWQMQRHSETVFYLENMQPTWLPPRQRWLPTVGVGLGSALIVEMVLGLIYGLSVGLSVGLGGRLGIGLFGGLSVGLGVGLVAYSQQIEHIEAVRWSWSSFRSNLLIAGVGGLVVGLVVGLVGGLVYGLEGELFGGLFGGLVTGLVIGLVGGLVIEELETKATPNQGIRRSAGNAVRYGLVGGLVGGLGFGLVGGLGFGLVGGLGFGLVGGLLCGGRSCLQHGVLRLLLARTRAVPLRYVPFLDFAAQRILLRKVGGGYSFIHRTLLEYFAKQYTRPETAEQSASSEDT